ncbi:MAG: peptide ABC transporter substrate-binding protein [Chloroflexota bacterium]
MRKIGWQLAIAVGGLLLVLGLLLGQTPGPEADLLQPVQGGSYAEALIGRSVRLNPLLDRYNQVDRDIDRLIYGALVRFNSRGEPIPELAESFAISADASLYNFTLRGDARWHDGEPVTADDVIFTYSKLKEGGLPGSEDLQTFWQDIAIVKLDEKNVQFQLPERYAPFLDYLTVGLLPDHLLRGVSAEELIDHPFNLEPVGTGPFRFESFLEGDSGQIVGVSLTAFEEYGPGRPFLERVEFRFYEDPSAALQAYRDGQVDGIGAVTGDILDQVLIEPGLNLYSVRSPHTATVFLNTRSSDKPFLGEKEFRQALLLAVNREQLIGSILEGQGLLATSPILPGSWAHADGLDPLPYDPALAVEKLAALGWELPVGAVPGTPEYVRTNGELDLSFELAYPELPLYRQIAFMLQSAWAKVGIQVELSPVSSAEILPSLLEPRRFEAVLTELDTTQLVDPDPYPFWHDSQVETGQNYSGYQDRNISIWLEQARITTDRIRRQELYRDFQYRFRDQAPALLLFHSVYNYAVSAEVRGARLGPIYDPSDRFADIPEWYLLIRRGFTASEETG